MSYFVYCIYNLLYQFFSVIVLFYASMYVNGFFIPNSLKWEGGK